jgi:hydroxymethylpyrimidine pyrophosphatase-like HAD family hydrolase
MSKSGKLIFLDIDGTLTEPGSNTPPESALKALEMTKAKGNKVFLCTGRNVAMLAPL